MPNDHEPQTINSTEVMTVDEVLNSEDVPNIQTEPEEFYVDPSLHEHPLWPNSYFAMSLAAPETRCVAHPDAIAHFIVSVSPESSAPLCEYCIAGIGTD